MKPNRSLAALRSRKSPIQVFASTLRTLDIVDHVWLQFQARRATTRLFCDKLCYNSFVDIRRYQPASTVVDGRCVQGPIRRIAGCAWLRSIVIVEVLTAISCHLSRTFPISVNCGHLSRLEACLSSYDIGYCYLPHLGTTCHVCDTHQRTEYAVVEKASC